MTAASHAARLTAVELGGDPGRPLLLLGPSLGTSAVALWGECAQHLAGQFHVVAWDLPGHGRNLTPAPDYTIADLAAGVLALAAQIRPDEATFAYAGVSVGGTVGLQLLLDAPQRVRSAALLCTGARILTEEAWRERAERVLARGVGDMVEGSATRWFGPGFTEREPAVAGALLQSLRDTDSRGYAQACLALAEFDVTDRLGEIEPPVLAVAGAADAVTTPESLRQIATGVRHGRLVVIDGVAHLAPAEAPAETAELLRHHFLSPAPPPGRSVPATQPLLPTRTDTGSIPVIRTEPNTQPNTQPKTEPKTEPRTGYEAGRVVRREVLGAAHVEASEAAATPLTRDFQHFLTEYAWGTIWTRPGLDRRSRSMITLTALVAGGHHDELALHLRAARTNGLTDDEIKEVLLHSAVYCGVPAANKAFRIAQEVLGPEA